MNYDTFSIIKMSKNAFTSSHTTQHIHSYQYEFIQLFDIINVALLGEIMF